MAYRAEIQIGVAGVGQLGALEKSLRQVSNYVDMINAKQIKAGFNVQNLNTYNAQLEKAWQNINKAALGSKEELKAVEDLVRAKNNQIQAQERLNGLIAKEEAAQRRIIATADAGFGVQGPAAPKVSGGARRGPSSPIGGGRGFPGSPGAQAAMFENLALGAGFPLLFGGGAGQVAGGLLGSFVGTGFGGQILGSAIGQQLEDAQRRIAEIGNATQQLNMDSLRDSAITVTAELTNQVRLLQQAGQADAARAAIADQVTLQTGLLPGAVKDITNNVGLLGNTWNEFLSAVSGTLSIIGAPFVSTLTLILQGLAKALQFVNFIASGIATVLKNVVGWAAGLLNLGGLLGNIKNQTTAINEEEQKRIAALQAYTDIQFVELMNTQKILNIEAQRTLGRTIAEKEINLELDRRLSKQAIENEYAEKAKKIREEYGGVTSEVGKRELELALQINEARKNQALREVEIKNLLKEQQLEIEKNTEKYNEAAEAAQRQITALDRGAAVQQSQLSATAAINDLYGVQLQRQYELAKTAEERFNIATRMFEQQVRAAEIEYQQAIANNSLLVQKAVLEGEIVKIKYQQLEAEKAIAVAQAQGRGNTPEQIKEISAAYDKALNAQGQAVDMAAKQVDATREIAANQDKVAEAVYRTKVVQAESAYAQKLTSQEIGVSTDAADELAGSLGVGAANAHQLAGGLSSAAQQAAGLVVELSRIENMRATSVTAQTGYQAQYQYSDGSTGSAYIQAHYAKGGYVTGPTNAMIAEGGEAEYVIPASKMSEAMARYAAGQRGSSVIPASINPQVNVTTGPVMNMNGSNYVSQRDFMAGMQTASRRGAEMALQMLQRSNNTRRMAGIS